MRIVLLTVFAMTCCFQISLANIENQGDRKASLMVQRARYVVEMSDDSIARQKSLIKLKEYATQNNKDAYNALGILYLNGKGLPKDTLKAFDMFEKSTMLGLKDGMCNLAKLLREGVGGVKRDYAAAFKYYKMAADLGHHIATYSLARCFFRGEGVNRDFEKAYELYCKANDFNLPAAKFRVGTCLYTGKGVKKDKQRGLVMVQEVYKEGFTKAARFLKYNKLPLE
ncbi:tetratricopeptide repeat protein [Prolixibacteraceae bacterium]|nr:tetratricopeptide repeat protein [Prolixibacteraceae bacterium]